MSSINTKLTEIVESELSDEAKIKKICITLSAFFDLYYVCVLILYHGQRSKLYIRGTNFSNDYEEIAMGRDLGVYVEWKHHMSAIALKKQETTSGLLDLPESYISEAVAELAIPITCNEPHGVLRILTKDEYQFTPDLIVSLEDCVSLIKDFLCKIKLK